MDLTQLVARFDLPIRPGEQWAAAGPGQDAWPARFPAVVWQPFRPEIGLQLDGLLLAGALSGGSPAQAEAWLRQTAGRLKESARLIVIEWQADGPLEVGPELEHRFKKGRLGRLLRQLGFGRLETLAHQPHYYILQATRAAPPAPADHFIDVAGLDELPKNGMKPVELLGCQLVIANTGKEIVAFARACPHAGSPLERGILRRRDLACRQHGYIWDVCTGEPVEPADEDILTRYPVRIDAERRRVLVALTPL
jgi:nitrite reductase/ring-hydroxylating ferredoxin subunit